MLQIQALKMEELIDNKENINQTSYSKIFSNEKKSSHRRDLKNYSNSSTHVNSFCQFTTHNSPQKVEDFLLKINKKKKPQGDLSICLY